MVEHHANLLPWARLCRPPLRRVRRSTAPSPPTTSPRRSTTAPRPRLLAITGASNVTGWLPPLDAIIDAAHDRGVPVLVDAAQLAPHAPLPADADFLAWSGHKMYAPFGAGVLVGPRSTFTEGDPFLAGGGAVDLVDLDEVVWTDPPEREEAGSPNVIGAVALHAAIDELERIGWDADRRPTTTRWPSRAARAAWPRSPACACSGPGADADTLPLATFVVEGDPHALVAARLSAEFGIGVRHGCFCAHPYLLRLLDLSPAEVAAYRRGRAGGRPPRDPRRRAGQRRPVDLVGRRRPPSRRRRPRSRRAGPPRSPTSRTRHRRLLAGHRPARLDRRGTEPRSAMRPRVALRAIGGQRSTSNRRPVSSSGRMRT